MIQLIILIVIFIYIYFKYKFYIQYKFDTLIPSKLNISTYSITRFKQSPDLINNIVSNYITTDNNIIIIYKYIYTTFNSELIYFIYLIINTYSNFILPFKILYTNNLYINSTYNSGKYFVIKYNYILNNVDIESSIYTKDYNTDILFILNQIKNYCNQSKNVLLLLNYNYNTKTKKLWVTHFDKNVTNCNSYLYAIVNVLLLLSKYDFYNIKKQILLLSGEIMNEINGIQKTYLIKDKMIQIKKYINYHKLDNSIKKIKQKKRINISGIDISSDIAKSILENKNNKNNKNIHILDKDFIKSNFIGHGAISNVYKNGNKVLKIIKDEVITNPKKLNIVQSEINIAKKISNIKNYNRYFPKYYSTYLVKVNNKLTIAIEYEYIDGIRLSPLLYSKTVDIQFDKLLQEIIDVNNFLNKNGIHRIDNHNNNIIFTKSNNIKLIDYGYTKLVDNTNPIKQLDTHFYFKLIIELALYIILTTNDKILLNKILKEYIQSMNHI